MPKSYREQMNDLTLRYARTLRQRFSTNGAHDDTMILDDLLVMAEKYAASVEKETKNAEV